jgi:hypothetical protein
MTSPSHTINLTDVQARLARWQARPISFEQLSKRQSRAHARRPSMASLIKRAEKAGRRVTSITTPDGTTIRFADPEPSDATNPWLAVRSVDLKWADMRKPLIVVLPLVLLSGVFADGFFYSAHAQCAPTDKIYIDPRLVPKPPNISPNNMMGILANPYASPEIKGQMYQQYQQQGQPIVVPYGTGKVLVSPTNPCIQQYIP